MSPANPCPFQSWQRGTDGLLTPVPGLAGLGAITLIKRAPLVGSDGVFSFTDIPQIYNHLEVIGPVRSDVSAESDNADMRVNNDSDAGDYAWVYVGLYDGGKYDSRDASDTEMTLCMIDGDDADSGQFSVFRALLSEYRNTAFDHEVIAQAALFKNKADANDIIHSVASGHRNSSVAINRVDVFPHSGTNFIDGSALCLYGRL